MLVHRRVTGAENLPDLCIPCPEILLPFCEGFFECPHQTCFAVTPAAELWGVLLFAGMEEGVGRDASHLAGESGLWRRLRER